jgi:putative oxidoreductase
LRRLFSTFADGSPGAGLLFMRLVAGSMLVAQGLSSMRTGPSIGHATRDVTGMAAGVLLLAGLWTPIAGSLAAILEGWNTFSLHGDPWSGIPLGTLAAALAVLGPGAWSVDARLFGWKRIDIRDKRQSNGFLN